MATSRSLPSDRCGDEARLRELLGRLEALPVVKQVGCDENYHNGRVIAWALW